MNCLDVRRDALALAARPRDEIAAAAWAEARVHAATCPGCTQVLAEAEAVWHMLGLAHALPDAEQRSRAGARLRAESRWDRLVALLGRGLALVLAVVGVSLALTFGSSPEGEFAASIGWHCALAESLYATGPIAFLAFAVRRKWLAPGEDVARGERVAMATAAGIGALIGQAVLSVRCPIDGIAHDLVFHTVPLVLLVATGAMIAKARFWRNGLSHPA